MIADKPNLDQTKITDYFRKSDSPLEENVRNVDKSENVNLNLYIVKLIFQKIEFFR